MRINYHRDGSNVERRPEQQVVGFYGDEGTMQLRLIFRTPDGTTAEITLDRAEAQKHLTLMKAMAS